MQEDEVHHLSVMMAEISSKMQIILDKQEELADNIEKIRKQCTTLTGDCTRD